MNGPLQATNTSAVVNYELRINKFELQIQIERIKLHRHVLSRFKALVRKIVVCTNIIGVAEM